MCDGLTHCNDTIVGYCDKDPSVTMYTTQSCSRVFWAVSLRVVFITSSYSVCGCNDCVNFIVHCWFDCSQYAFQFTDGVIVNALASDAVSTGSLKIMIISSMIFAPLYIEPLVPVAIFCVIDVVYSPLMYGRTYSCPVLNFKDTGLIILL